MLSEISEHEIELALIGLCFGYKIVKDVVEGMITWKLKPKQ